MIELGAKSLVSFFLLILVAAIPLSENFQNIHTLLIVSADSTNSSFGGYWLNFSLTDSSHQVFSTFGFHFYTSANSSVSRDGMSQTPYSIELLARSGRPKLSYVTFNKIEPLFESYLYIANNSYPVIHHLSVDAPNDR
jgi:hypothetical protein